MYYTLSSKMSAEQDLMLLTNISRLFQLIVDELQREHTNFFYTKRGAIKVDFYTSAKSEKSEMIVECSDECQCDDSCPTKVVQVDFRFS